METEITEQQYKDAQELIKAYEEHSKLELLSKQANVYKELKAFLKAKKESKKLCEWDDVHHQEVLNIIIQLEHKYNIDNH